MKSFELKKLKLIAERPKLITTLFQIANSLFTRYSRMNVATKI